MVINKINGANKTCHSDPSERGRTKNLVAEDAILPEQPQTLLFLRSAHHGEKR
jgi:hypothetical protein